MLSPHQPWPPDYVAEFAARQHRIRRIRAEPVLRFGMAERYRQDPVAWINHWAFTYDPRIAGSDIPTTLPFVLFRRQVEFADFLLACVNEQQNGLVEKSRDMGATWLCCAVSVWLWLYWPGAAVGWGSRKEQLVDKIGKLIYFKDESAHYERPEKIEAALADNTNCQIDISSVNGLGNVFHRRREAGQEYHPGQALARNRVNVFVMDWRGHPAKDQRWYDDRKAKAESDGLLHVFAQEVDRDHPRRMGDQRNRRARKARLRRQRRMERGVGRRG
jgi:hypothetical protein